MNCTRTTVGKGKRRSHRFETIPPDPGWETVVDFTDGGRTEGVAIEEVLKILQNMKKSPRS